MHALNLQDRIESNLIKAINIPSPTPPNLQDRIERFANFQPGYDSQYGVWNLQDRIERSQNAEGQEVSNKFTMNLQDRIERPPPSGLNGPLLRAVESAR